MNSLLGSFNGIANVTIVIMLILVMFSILGVFLFKNRMNYCLRNEIGDNEDWTEFGVSKAQCLAKKGDGT